MQPDNPGAAGRGSSGEEATDAEVIPRALALLGAWQVARAEVMRDRAALEAQATKTEASAGAYLVADEALVAHLLREGTLLVGHSEYSLDAGGAIRWRRRRFEPAGWKHYVT